MAARGLCRDERRCALLLATLHGIWKVYQTPVARIKSADRTQDRRRLFAAISAVLNDRHRGNGARQDSPRFLHRDLDLRGVEASILPDIPSVATNVTTIIVAERIAQNCAREQERSRRCLVLERKRSHQFGLALPRSIILILRIQSRFDRTPRAKLGLTAFESHARSARWHLLR